MTSPRMPAEREPHVRCFRLNPAQVAQAEGVRARPGRPPARDLLLTLGVDAVGSALAVEGGGLAVDGADTPLTTESVVLNPNRNPGILHHQAEAEFARTLGIRRTIWLPGSAHVFGSNGHIDGLACFVRPGVVLFQRGVDEGGQRLVVNEANRLRSRARRTPMVECSRCSRSARCPASGGAGRQSGRARAPYINFSVANGGPVMPGCGLGAVDDEAREVLAAAFPGRSIARVDISHLAVGGIHCITRQHPVG